MMSWPEIGIINWIGKPEYDLSWLDAENITYITPGDLSLLSFQRGRRYSALAAWMDDFQDRETSDEDKDILDAVEDEVIPPTALVWAADKDDEDEIDTIYHTQDIPKIFFSMENAITDGWWICKDFEYTQAVIDKVKELNPKEWAKM